MIDISPSPLTWSIAVIAAYLLGSIPFGLLLGKTKGIDLRKHGSGNIGATNAFRFLGPTLGTTCFILDVSKGAVPTLIAGALLGPFNNNTLGATHMWWWVATAIAAVMGHMFSIFLRFKGGKGIATSFGAMLALYPYVTIPALLALVVWVLSVIITRYIGISSCIAMICLPLFIAARTAMQDTPERWGNALPFLVLTSMMMVVVLLKHTGNIRRTLAGIEPRIGRSKSTKPSAT